MSSIQDDPETRLIILCSVRYALSHNTSISELVVNWCKRHWRELSAKEQRLIKEDVDNNVNSGQSLNGDMAAWSNFYIWIMAQEALESELPKIDAAIAQIDSAVALADELLKKLEGDRP